MKISNHIDQRNITK